MTPALDMRGICKAFPGVKALDDVSFDCRPGEVHAICGENGAGKSTLMKVLGGSYRPDAGEIRIDGAAMRFAHPRAAAMAGIAIIHQELSLLPHRSVTENIFMGHELVRPGFAGLLLDRGAMRARARVLLDRVGAQIDPDRSVAGLSIAQQQLVEIAKALLLDARILVLDEPTAALDDRDARQLLDLIRILRGQGVALVYISHRMPEVAAIADRVTVLKDGRLIWTRPQAEATIPAIVSAMVGRDLKDFYPAAPTAAPGETVLELDAVQAEGLPEISLTLRRGEILGVAGLEDSGKGQLARLLAGDLRPAGGTARLAGRPMPLGNPRRMIAAGLGYLPADRKREGLVLRQSVRDNAALALRAMRPAWARPAAGVFAPAMLDAGLKRMDVRAAHFGQEIGALSGGNQQKAIIARWLALDPAVLLFVEPTRGIDIAAKAAIYQTMREVADQGRGIVVVSSDLPELIGISDRVLVMHRGTIAGVLPRDPREEEIMQLSLGVSV
ncbi:sugar ABC transporter ATP-binding protein [Gemmobacter serpentinus]|uniref:sugar ABC transporter ATP-binding protein n=1 Tax=Gemmobacter serpentinus TaxID=2652247 RepID=UPI00124CFF75|nr:sugar ABC transporter ATP-binding protein [Gemmobacter serpentinus]